MLARQTVPAGLTAMQALDRELDVETRYGGRFVQSIEGVEGDVSKQRDWFWFLNGIEADRSAADYRLRAGRRRVVGLPLVAAARCASRSSSARSRSRSCTATRARRDRSSSATRPGRERAPARSDACSHATSVAPLSDTPPEDANVFYTVRGTERFTASLRDESGRRRLAGASSSSPATPPALARNPTRFRFRYEVP